VDGKTVPVVSVTSGAMKAAARSASAPRREAAALHPAVKLPTISPAIGRIPRPEWSHPYELAKRPDVAVIGSQRVTIAPGGGNAAPASNATPATEHRP
jgi:hypothetical protein